MSLQIQALELFPTPVFLSKAQELDNTALSAAVYQIRDMEQNPNNKAPKRGTLSNIGGYHTQDILKHSAFDPLRQFIINVLNTTVLNGKWFAEKPIDESFIVNMWSIINQKGHANSTHNHPHAWFSGVYYPKVPADSKKSGNICFKDPNAVRQFTRSFYRNVQSDLCCLSPEEGMLILFPGWLEHSVAPNQTDEDRIAISFNIKMHPVQY